MPRLGLSEPLYLSAQQAASACNLSKPAFLKAVEFGDLPRGVRLGKDVRWSVEALRGRGLELKSGSDSAIDPLMASIEANRQRQATRARRP